MHVDLCRRFALCYYKRQREDFYISTLRQLLPKQSARYLLVVCLLSCVVCACNVWVPITLKLLIDDLTTNVDMAHGLALFAYLGLALGIGRACTLIKMLLYAQWEQKLLVFSYRTLFAKTLHASPSFLNSLPSSQLSAGIVQDISHFCELAKLILCRWLPLTIEFILTLAICLILFNVYISIILCAGFVAYILIFIVAQRRVWIKLSTARETILSRHALLFDLLSSWQTIKAMNAVQSCTNLLTRKLKQSTSSLRFLQESLLPYTLIQEILLLLMFLGVNYTGFVCMLYHEISLGSCLLINLFLFQLIKPLQQLFLPLQKYSLMLESCANLVKRLKTANEYPLTAHASYFAIENIQIKNLCVPGSLPPVSLTLTSGNKYALTGLSAHAKSTLFRVLSGLETQFTGEIWINNIAIQNIPVNALRRSMMLITAAQPLLNTDLHSNILFSDHAQRERIDKALFQVTMQNTIDKLPFGLNTHIHASSQLFSDNEQQCLLLSRLFACQYSAALLDASLDRLPLALASNIVKELLRHPGIVLFASARVDLLKLFDQQINLDTNSQMSRV